MADHNNLKHVYAEQFLTPMPHEGCWLAVQRIYQRIAPEKRERDWSPLLEEVEVNCGKWSKDLKGQKLTKAKIAAAREAFPDLKKRLLAKNEEMGGGEHPTTPAPDAPKITGRRG